MPSFDGDALIITLDSGVTSIDWIDVYSEWKDWLISDPQNRGYPQAFRTTGGDPLNALLNAGSYWFLRNDLGWRIKPPEEDITILAAGNLAPENADIDMFLPTVGAYTTQILGLQPITQGFSLQLAEGLEHGVYNDRVTVDATGGDAGTATPIGTPKQPVSNVTDAVTIANDRGFSKLYFITDYTLTTGDNVANFTLEGINPTQITLTIEAQANVLNCEISNVTVGGILDGGTTLKDCTLDTISYFNGQMVNCTINDVIYLGGGAVAHLQNCFSGIPGTATPIIDMGGSGQQLAMRAYSGGIELQNKTGTDPVSVDMISGHLILDSTVTDGTIVVRGHSRLTDNSTGNTVVEEDAIWDDLIATHQESGSFGELMQLIGKLTGNKVTKVGDVITIYEANGTTPWRQYNLANGGRVQL